MSSASPAMRDAQPAISRWLHHSLFRILFLSVLTLWIFVHGENAYPAQATVSWIPPTTNTDGTALTDLAGYKVYYGTVSWSY